VFPDGAFIDGDICGVPVRSLDPKSELDDVKLFSRVVDEGILETVRLNLLSSAELLVLAPKSEQVLFLTVFFFCFFLCNQRQQVLERYCFSFSNETGEVAISKGGDGGDASKNNSVFAKSRDCKDSVRIMLRKLLVTTDALGPVTEGSQLAVRLSYKSHVPAEYEPRFFQTGGQYLQLAMKAPLELNLGQVDSTGCAMEFTFQANPEQLRQDSDEQSSIASIVATSPTGTEPQHKKTRR
jgi:hypothetical protein